MLCQQVTQKHKKEHYLHSFQDYGFYAYKPTYYILSQTFSTLWEKLREAQSYKNLWNTGCPAFKSPSEWNNYKWLARLRKIANSDNLPQKPYKVTMFEKHILTF